MPENQLVIFGAGGLGRELKTWIEKIGPYQLIGFFDDNLPVDTMVDGLRVLGGLQHIYKYASKKLNLVIAIGNTEVRARLIHDLDQVPNLIFPILIHPRAIIDDNTSLQIGRGSVITAGCVLTTNITLGEHVLVNLNTTIGHDCVIGDGCCIMPGVNISGKVTIGKHVLLGTGSCVLNNISIGENTRIGAGAVVTRSLPANCTAVGLPAKPRNV